MPNIEELLRKAMEEGKFDDLPGKGKPLNLGKENPHADPEWELAYKMLKDNGYSLPWIETIRDIERDIESARHGLRLAWEWRQAAAPSSEATLYDPAEWRRALEAFKSKLTALNQRIRDYNLEVPSPHFQRPVLNFDQEVEKITGTSE